MGGDWYPGGNGTCPRTSSSGGSGGSNQALSDLGGLPWRGTIKISLIVLENLPRPLVHSVFVLRLCARPVWSPRVKKMDDVIPDSTTKDLIIFGRKQSWIPQYTIHLQLEGCEKRRRKRPLICLQQSEGTNLYLGEVFSLAREHWCCTKKGRMRTHSRTCKHQHLDSIS